MSGGATEESIKLWLKVGNLKKLEAAVLDGYGGLLRGRTSRIPKINKFLKRVPHYQAKIASIHNAASSGDVRGLENLLDRKGLALARGPEGETLLHTAVMHSQGNVVKYLLDKYPMLLVARDHGGRSCLHYAAVTNDDGHMFDLLLCSGADREVKDIKGKTPTDYRENPMENRLDLPDVQSDKKNDSRKQSQDGVSSLLRQPSPIAPLTKTEVMNLIAKGDVAKLERIILHGYGDRLIGETASSGRVRSLIESIPQHLDKLAAIKLAVENGSLREVKNLLNRRCLVLARDGQGCTVLHHAVINNQKDIAQYLILLAPRAVFAKDHDKRTPVHYAAALSDDEIYRMLSEIGGNVSLPDCDGKTPEYYRQNPGALLDSRGSEGSAKKTSSIASNGSQSNKMSTISGKTNKTLNGRSASTRNLHHSSNGGSSSNNSSVVKLWLRSGDMEKLEKAVIDGHGLKLIRETTSDPRARAFLRTVPAYMSKIVMVHEAVCQGSLRTLKVVLDRKKLIMSRDQLGLGLLHKAILYGHTDIAQFLVENYPETVNIKDKSGRTALHYSAILPDSDKLFSLLVKSGADPQQTDTRRNGAEFYRQNKDQLDVKEIVNRVNRQRNRHLQSVAANKPMTSFNNNKNINDYSAANNNLIINGGNIRKWIHAEDLNKLQQVVLDGQGYKLLLETSNNPRVKQFLVGVPALVNKLKEVHNAACAGDVQSLEAAVEKPCFLKSKDEAGMTPLHKAVLLENEDIVSFIVASNVESVTLKDDEGRTPAHYAAGLKDGGRIYATLMEKMSVSPVDNRGKTPEHYLRHPGELDMRQLIAHAQRYRSSNKPNGAVNVGNNVNSVPQHPRRPAGPNNLRPVRKASGNGVSSETIARAIQMVDLEKLEQLVLDGYGKRLLGKSAWSEDVRAFLKKVPQYMDKIYALHTAAATGDLLGLQQLLDKKALATSRDECGLTALHKAVKYGQVDVAKYLLQTFPACHSARDQDGRTPLHYAAIYKDREDIYKLLLKNGADAKVQDQRGKSAEHYLLSVAKQEAPSVPRSLSDNEITIETSDSSDESSGERTEDEREINEWILNGNVDKLEKVVIEGRGDKLLGRSSDNDESQEFLESVPVYMGKIRAIHNAAASGQVKDLQSVLSEKPILALSLDHQAACPLHRAVLHGHKDTMKFLANNYPQSLKIADKSGLTPLHYAAMVNDDGYFYRLLHNCGADPNVKDNTGLTPGHMLRGSRAITMDELSKRYEERKVPPRPHSVQTWERPPTEELLRALTPSPMFAAALVKEDKKIGTAMLKPADDLEAEINELQEEGSNELQPDEAANILVVEEVEENGDGDDKNEGNELLKAEDSNIEDAVNSDVLEEVENVTSAFQPDNFEKNEDEDNVEKATDIELEVIEPEKQVEIVDFDAIEKPDEIDVADVAGEADAKDVFQNSKEDADRVVDFNDTVEEIESELKDDIEGAKLDIEELKQEIPDGEIETNEKDEEEKVNGTIEVEDEEEQVDDAIVQAEDEGDKVEGNIESEDKEEKTDDDTVQVEDEEETIDGNIESEEKEEKFDDGAVQVEDKEEKTDVGNFEVEEVEENVDGNDSADQINDDTVEVEDNSEKTGNEEVANETEIKEPSNDEMDDDTVPDDREQVVEEDLKDAEEKEANNNEEDEIVQLGPLTEADESVENIVQQSEKEEDEGKKPKLETQGTVESDDDVVVEVNQTSEKKSNFLGTPTESLLSLPSPWSVEGDYLTAVLGDALIIAMAEVSRVRPNDPVAYLALLLYRYLQKSKSVERQDKIGKLIDGPLSMKELSELRADDGDTLVHFAASKADHNEGAFDQLLNQSGFNLALRNEMRRTARDVAVQEGQIETMEAVDRYVFRLVRNGHIKSIETLVYDGYDHLLDIVDDEGNDTLMISELTHQLEMVHLLKTTEKTRTDVERLCEAVEKREVQMINELLEANPRLVLGRNSKDETAVTVASTNNDDEMMNILSIFINKIQ